MKLLKRFTPKRLFRSKNNHPSADDTPSSSSSSSVAGSATPTSVLPPDSSDSDQTHAVVSRKELEAILCRIASDDEVAVMLSELDGGGNGLIRLEAVLGRVGSGFDPAGESELRETFEFFDGDQDGRITAEELQGALSTIGDDRCTLEDCRRMIADVDENGDGFVCFAEFVRMMELQR